jgi:hypothetical protein
MWSNCERLDMLAGKEPLSRRQNAKIRSGFFPRNAHVEAGVLVV